jgi:hypothetical protein
VYALLCIHASRTSGPHNDVPFSGDRAARTARPSYINVPAAWSSAATAGWTAASKQKQLAHGILGVRLSKDQRTVIESLPTTGLAISSGERPSNALPLSGGRPSAADHPLQRLVSRRTRTWPSISPLRVSSRLATPSYHCEARGDSCIRRYTPRKPVLQPELLPQGRSHSRPAAQS